MQELNPLVGNWKLVSLQTIVDGAAAPPDLFGSNPRGYLSLTREGRMALIITRENRKGGMSDPERAELHKRWQVFVALPCNRTGRGDGCVCRLPFPTTLGVLGVLLMLRTAANEEPSI